MVTVSKPPFEITREGWGIFDIRATVFLKDGKGVRQLERALDFTGEVNTTYCTHACMHACMHAQ